VDPRTAFAPLGRRLAAYLIDLVLASAPSAVLLGVGGGDTTVTVVSIVIALVVGLVVWALVPSRGGKHNGQGLGGQLVGIRMFDARGEGEGEVDFWQAFVHGIGYVLFGIVWGIIDGITVLIDRHRQSYSDGWAATYTLKADADPRLAPALIRQGFALPAQMSIA
jgi:uncharacterized RDD family membrane protein YckC